MPLSLSHHSGQKLPVSRAVLVPLKNAVLNEEYELSVAVVSSREMRTLNRRHREKDATTDILSFSLSDRSGEIVLCVPEIRKQAPTFGRTVKNFTQFLFIHGLLHLKGLRHGSTMEHEERKFGKKFNI